MRLDAIRTAITAADAADPAVYGSAVGLEKEIEQLHETLRGNRRRSRFNDAEPTSINRRLGRVRRALRGATYGPTVHDREQLAIAREGFATLRRALDAIVLEELPRLEDALEQAGVPWTPGRPVPGPR